MFIALSIVISELWVSYRCLEYRNRFLSLSMVIPTLNTKLEAQDIEINEKMHLINQLNDDVKQLNRDLNELKSRRVAYLGNYIITYYCSCEQCCGKNNGITASGQKVQDGVTIAADSSLPFGTKVYIQGIGLRVVQDRGGAIKGNIMDVYVNSHDKAIQLGRSRKDVWMVFE